MSEESLNNQYFCLSGYDQGGGTPDPRFSWGGKRGSLRTEMFSAFARLLQIHDDKSDYVYFN